ncbi:MAG: hypothetical protein HN509_11565 [Halobacteriovoraceae bacterium]|jgi:hypothetical protein|nr:hypothetical protein [Halobacteriovoraceae bacterium]MBT5095545.1 hypothetical protein [Halobacteriovoraceae bacterium]
MNKFITRGRDIIKKLQIRIFPPTCNPQDQNCQSGQTFFEFIFLMLILVVLSYTLMRGFSTGIGTRWKAIVEIIATPTDTPVELN